MKSGCPPTARKARTGESTPPGRSNWASVNNSFERVISMSAASSCEFAVGLTALVLLMCPLCLCVQDPFNSQLPRANALGDANASVCVASQRQTRMIVQAGVNGRKCCGMSEVVLRHGLVPGEDSRE